MKMPSMAIIREVKWLLLISTFAHTETLMSYVNLKKDDAFRFYLYDIPWSYLKLIIIWKEY